MRILHISAHLGGGAGKAISGLIKSTNESKISHEIVVLEQLEKTTYLNDIIANDIKVVHLTDIKNLELYFDEFDLIVINWWNHPKIIKLFMEFPNVPMRIII